MREVMVRYEADRSARRELRGTLIIVVQALVAALKTSHWVCIWRKRD